VLLGRRLVVGSNTSLGNLVGCVLLSLLPAFSWYLPRSTFYLGLRLNDNNMIVLSLMGALYGGRMGRFAVA
jgi:hypothetical protein